MTFKALVCVALLASTAAADSVRNAAEIRVNTLIRTADGTEVQLALKDTFETGFWDPALLARVLKCQPTGPLVLKAVIEASKGRTRVISSGPDRKLRTCIETALATFKSDNVIAYVTVTLDPMATQHPGRGGAPPSAPKRDNPY